ncbi:exocyst complex component EXO70B1 [Gastrolobium bilobum]|uniref:exocyst complex component EXO70B1 n=1 Tax=Gastrolobium bilobum TaxID=150636 RepID=UPI002AB2A05E|nr:exocyst complex component EXO70B1 [Gastrolobium bilobum]
MTTTTSIGGGTGGGGDDRVLATAQQILKSLNTAKEDRQDMLLIFSSFDNRLSGISDLVNGEDSKSSSDEDLDRFEAAEKVILADASHSGEPSRQSTSLFDPPNGPVEYLSAVDEIILWMEQFSIAPPPPPSSSGRIRQVTVDRAENAIQLAMSRLEEELRHVLICNTIPLDAVSSYGSIRRVSLSFASHDCAIDENLGSFGEVSDRGSHRFHERGASLGDDDLFVDLVRPDAVPDLREIIDRMVRSGYERECLQVYSSVRRDALDECLATLGVERLSIEEVQKVEWKSLDEKMKNWVQAAKVVVGVLLSGEKRLCDTLFGDLDEFKEICFNETAKGCVMQLLNFGEAISICKRSPEKLFRILDMYEALRDALPDLQAMVSDELVISEAKGVLSGLGEAAKGTFAEFENCIRNETSKKPVVTGDVHPLPRYVMNYLKLLVDYGDPMDSLLEITEEDLYRFQNDFGGDGSQLEAMSPLGRQILLLMSELEYNLVEKSRLYEDSAMQQIFLMNNLYYLVRKVKDSDLGKVLGDDWIRKRRGQIRQYATGYLRACWSKALSCLKDEGIGGSSSNASKMALKERFKSFNACFEEIYRIQTAWKVPDDQLREELRISISEKVLPAYRAFMGRFGSQLEGRHAGKYIKYTPDDLETYLSDLFEGSPAVLHHIRRKST